MTHSRVPYFDYLNVFSCISVIALHCNGYFHSYSQDSNWVFSAVIQVLFYCAVPVFFMLSGATLLDYGNRYSTKEFYQKRIKKTILPYVFFTIFFYIWDIVLSYIQNGELHFSLLTLSQMLVAGTVPHADFWFFIPLFLLYLFMPFLSYIATGSSKLKLMFLIGALIFFSGIYPVIAHFMDYKTLTPPIFGFVLYAFMGYFLHKYDFEKNNIILTVVCALGIFTFITRFCFLLKFSDGKVDLLMSYLGLYAIIPSAAIFMLFKRFCTSSKKFIITLSTFSFGVFLIQEFIIQTLRFVSTKMGINEFFVQSAGIVIVYALCCCIVFLVRKIKFLKWMFP